MSEDQQGRAATLSPSPRCPGPSSFPGWYFLTPVYVPMSMHGFTTCLEQEPGLPPVPPLSLSRQVGGGWARHPNHFPGPPSRAVHGCLIATPSLPPSLWLAI